MYLIFKIIAVLNFTFHQSLKIFTSCFRKKGEKTKAENFFLTSLRTFHKI